MMILIQGLPWVEEKVEIHLENLLDTKTENRHQEMIIEVTMITIKVVIKQQHKTTGEVLLDNNHQLMMETEDKML